MSFISEKEKASLKHAFSKYFSIFMGFIGFLFILAMISEQELETAPWPLALGFLVTAFLFSPLWKKTVERKFKVKLKHRAIFYVGLYIF